MKNNPSHQESLETAITIARKAGSFLRDTMHEEIAINSSVEKDIKLQADVATEKLITDLLILSSPYNILSEESGLVKKDATDGYRWIVDPLDGSLNFSRGIDLFAISIGLWKDNEPVLGVVYDFLHDKLYAGIVNDKATCNHASIHVSSVTEKKNSILATGFPVYSSFDKSSLENFVSSIQDFKKVRLFGSAALSIIHVAKGSIEAYTENNIAIWDVAAGLAILLAAGGKISFEPGKGPEYLNVYAHNGLIA
jgi:myo-inositol-1(or 4)-monophosphatase